MLQLLGAPRGSDILLLCYSYSSRIAVVVVAIKGVGLQDHIFHGFWDFP